MARNVVVATCRSRSVLHRIGMRWTVFAASALEDGPMRFAELTAHLRGTTPKARTETLGAVEAERPGRPYRPGR
jgi:DNA-binding HxlR family transcriptional regulator